MCDGNKHLMKAVAWSMLASLQADGLHALGQQAAIVAGSATCGIRGSSSSDVAQLVFMLLASSLLV
jgi:hypothetical protein